MGIFSFATNLIALVLLCFLKDIHGKYTRKIGGCDIYKGNWVFDNHNPVYNITNCPFIISAFDCRKHGRADSYYTKYRWQPHGCNIPSFDGRAFLSKYKGKRIMFVGDSLSLNQWQSLTCMLHVAAPEASYTLTRKGLVSTFTFPSYGVSLMFSRNAFLVDLVKEGNQRVMKLDSLSSSKSWEGIDVLIFDTWHWWLHTGRKQPWDFIEYGKTRVKDMDRLGAYEKALYTWARWVDTRVDPTTTKLFFQGISPDHGACEGKKIPLKNPEGRRPEAQSVLEKVLYSISKEVNLVDINGLSQLRQDGHPSVYGLGGHRGLDCTHWCLPGVPDTWNQLLYAALA